MIGITVIKATCKTYIIGAKLCKVVFVYPQHNSFVLALVGRNSRLMKLKRIDKKNITAFEVVGVTLNTVFNVTADEKVYLVKVMLMYGTPSNFASE